MESIEISNMPVVAEEDSISLTGAGVENSTAEEFSLTSGANWTGIVSLSWDSDDVDAPPAIKPPSPLPSLDAIMKLKFTSGEQIAPYPRKLFWDPQFDWH